MMHISGLHYGGMHFVWWILWIVLIFWIFALPYDIPGQRNEKKSPLDTLKERYAAGEITTEEFEERKKILTSGG